jgi:hypothetical protein
MKKIIKKTKNVDLKPIKKLAASDPDKARKEKRLSWMDDWDKSAKTVEAARNRFIALKPEQLNGLMSICLSTNDMLRIISGLHASIQILRHPAFASEAEAIARLASRFNSFLP